MYMSAPTPFKAKEALKINLSENLSVKMVIFEIDPITNPKYT